MFENNLLEYFKNRASPGLSCKKLYCEETQLYNSNSTIVTDLLADVLAFRGEQVDEVRDSAGVDDDAGLLGGAGSNVSQSPGGLELKDRVRQERDQPKRQKKC